jgi:hypothetical protein
MADNRIPNKASMEDKVDFSKVIKVRSMKEVYDEIKDSDCECGGKLFPAGPIDLHPPKGARAKDLYRLMYAFCAGCAKEYQKVYAIDTSSSDWQEEIRQGFADNPSWARLVSGNPIDPEQL